MAKKTDPVQSQPETPTEATTETPVVLDAACAIYRDKSGQPFGSVMTEGQANFGAITAAARAVVASDDA